MWVSIRSTAAQAPLAFVTSTLYFHSATKAVAEVRTQEHSNALVSGAADVSKRVLHQQSRPEKAALGLPYRRLQVSYSTRTDKR